MKDTKQSKRFLEPVYLNERSVLNCASYLLGGFASTSEVTERSGSSKSGGFKLEFPLIGSLFGSPALSAGAELNNERTMKTQRQYEIGAIHMQVVDAMKEASLLVPMGIGELLDDSGDEEKFFDIRVLLRPDDYFSFLGTLDIVAPLIAQVVAEFDLVEKFEQRNVEKSLVSSESQSNRQSNKSKSRTSGGSESKKVIDSISSTIISIVKQLQDDYLTSNQIQMIMWSEDKDPRPIGVVDIEVTENNAKELRAQLSGGKFHVIGKIVHHAKEGESIDLFEKTILANVVDLVRRLMLSQNNPQSIANYQKQARQIGELIESFVALRLEGPAVRMKAISICL